MAGGTFLCLQNGKQGQGFEVLQVPGLASSLEPLIPLVCGAGGGKVCVPRRAGAPGTSERSGWGGFECINICQPFLDYLRPGLG